MTQGAEDEIVLRFVHTADWHLGRRFPRFKDEQKLTRARRDALDRICGVVERSDAQVLLCAGDLFDDPHPAKEWWEAVAECFRRPNWNNRMVVLLPGNHDPLLADSVWAAGTSFRRALPAWVHVVDKSPLELALPGNAVLYAVPCTSKAGQRDPTLSIPTRTAGDERIRIGLVHGSTHDLPHCQVNFPIARDAVLERGLDYLAIGDTHGFRYVPEDRQHPPTIYPGAPEATAFDERDPGHVAVVMMTRQRRAMIQKERVSHWVWEEVTVRNINELRALRARTDLASRVLRLTVHAKLPAQEYQEAEGILTELGGTLAQHARVGVLELDRTALELDSSNIEELCVGLPPVLLAAVRRLKEEEAKPGQAEVAQRALFHLYSLAGKAG